MEEIKELKFEIDLNLKEIYIEHMLNLIKSEIDMCGITFEDFKNQFVLILNPTGNDGQIVHQSKMNKNKFITDGINERFGLRQYSVYLQNLKSHD